jgi:hypothetical protein
MGRYTYYCEVQHTKVELAPGVYCVIADKGFNQPWFPQLNRIITFSHRVWKQGPKGGVKIIKDRDWPCPMGYVTTNEEWMKKFTWVKLRARTLPV